MTDRNNGQILPQLQQRNPKPFFEAGQRVVCIEASSSRLAPNSRPLIAGGTFPNSTSAHRLELRPIAPLAGAFGRAMISASGADPIARRRSVPRLPLPHSLSGKPHVVFPRDPQFFLIHGCYRNMHPEYRFAYTPKSRVEFRLGKFH